MFQLDTSDFFLFNSVRRKSLNAIKTFQVTLKKTLHRYDHQDMISSTETINMPGSLIDNILCAKPFNIFSGFYYY